MSLNNCWPTPTARQSPRGTRVRHYARAPFIFPNGSKCPDAAAGCATPAPKKRAGTKCSGKNSPTQPITATARRDSHLLCRRCSSNHTLSIEESYRHGPTGGVGEDPSGVTLLERQVYFPVVASETVCVHCR